MSILHDEASARVYHEMERRSEFIDAFFLEVVPPWHIKIMKRFPFLKHIFGYTVAFYQDDHDRVSILRYGKKIATSWYMKDPIIGIDVAENDVDYSVVVGGFRHKDGTMEITSITDDPPSII